MCADKTRNIRNNLSGALVQGLKRLRQRLIEEDQLAENQRRSKSIKTEPNSSNITIAPW